MTAYDVLGAQPDMDRSQLRSCFRARLQQVHPDLNPTLPKAVERTREVIAAYELLSNAERRAALDAALKAEAESAARAQKKAKERARRASARRASARKASARKATTSSRKRKASRPSTTRGNVVEIDGQRVEFQGDGSVHIETKAGGTRVVMSSTSSGGGFSSTNPVSSAAGSSLGDRRVNGGRVDGTVLGDLYVNGGQVHLTGQVLGDVFMAADSSLRVSGQVIGDLHVHGATLVLTGQIIGDIHTGGGSVELRGQHLGSVF
jgi:curved DNA-binding protein CbpA